MFDGLARMKKKPMILFGAAVFALSLVPYLRVGEFELVNLDDYSYLMGTPVVNGLSWANVKWAFCSFGCMANWHPLTWLSYMADVSLWGLNPRAMHIHNTLLHAADAGLVFLLLETVSRFRFRGGGGLGSRFNGSKPPAYSLIAAALAALFWSLHPLRVESVAWVSERKDVLFLFWELMALIFWVKRIGVLMCENVNMRAPGGTPPVVGLSGGLTPPVGLRASVHFRTLGLTNFRTPLYWFLSVGCFIVAGMAKPTAMTFPVLAGLLEYLTARRVRFAALLWPFLLALVLCMITQWSQAAGGAMVSMAGVPFLARLANAVAAFGTYCWKLVVPMGLAVPYPHPWPEWPPFLLPGTVICVGYAAVLLWSGWEVLKCESARVLKWLVFGVSENESAGGTATTGQALDDRTSERSNFRISLFVSLSWFLVAVAPMLGLVNFGYQSHADRYTYLPGLGFALLAAVELEALFRHGRRVRVTVASAMAVLLAGWATLSWRQVQYWRNDRTLLSHAVNVTGSKNDVAQKILGIYTFGTTGNAEAALPYVEAVFRTNREGRRQFQLSYVFLLAKAGRLDEAKAEAHDYSEWLDRQRNRGIERANLTPDASSVWGGAESESHETFSVALRLCYAAIAYYGKDRDLAKEHIDSVLQANSGSLIGNYLYGLMALDEGRVQEAIAHWKLIKDDIFFTFIKVRISDLEAR